MAAPPMLSVRNATKRFGAVLALEDVSFELGQREIVALVGDNGAGKSTLIKCISGVHRFDSGSIEIAGNPVTIRTPHDSRRHGIETVYQDLALFDALTVSANLFVGRELGTPTRPAFAGWLSNARMRRVTSETLQHLGVHIPSLRTPVSLLSGGQRQAVALARAAQFTSRIVLLDEPTAALGVRETASVLRLVKGLPERGIAVLLISHNLDQVAAVADRVLVMRRGRKVGEAKPDQENHEQIVSMIVGAPSWRSTDTTEKEAPPSSAGSVHTNDKEEP
jgi:ABC-type sugar transport system ATPase subunit